MFPYSYVASDPVGGELVIHSMNQQPVLPDIPLVQFRKNSEVRFQKPLTVLQLMPSRSIQPTTKLGISSVSVTLPCAIGKTRSP